VLSRTGPLPSIATAGFPRYGIALNDELPIRDYLSYIDKATIQQLVQDHRRNPRLPGYFNMSSALTASARLTVRPYGSIAMFTPTLLL
jgi:hypothetical protein